MGKTFAPGEVPYAADLNNYLQAWAATVPSAVTNGTDIGGGIIEFTSQTSVTLTDVFADNYRMYRLFVGSTGTAAYPSLLLRTGASNSTTNYDKTLVIAANNTFSTGTVLNESAAIFPSTIRSNTHIQLVVDIARPNLASPTSMLATVGYHSNPGLANTNNLLAYTYHTHRPSTAYESLVVQFSASQSGSIRVYGFK